MRASRSSSRSERRVDGIVEQGGNRLFGRTVEKGLQHVAQRRSLRVVARHGRQVDVAGAVLLVPDVTLVFEDAQHRPDGRVARRIRQRGLDLGGGRAPLRIKDVDDLPLAAAQVAVGCRWPFCLSGP